MPRPSPMNVMCSICGRKRHAVKPPGRQYRIGNFNPKPKPIMVCVHCDREGTWIVPIPKGDS